MQQLYKGAACVAGFVGQTLDTNNGSLNSCILYKDTLLVQYKYDDTDVKLHWPNTGDILYFKFNAFK